ncbi:MAG: hypothetical protein QM743_10715 [Chitinophagaceae bacterium]
MHTPNYCKWFYFFLLLCNLPARAQPTGLEGRRYVYKDSYISISDSTLEFYHSWGCLTVNYFGRGRYYVYKDTIFMCTDIDVPDKRTTYRIEESLTQDDQVHFHFREYPSFIYSFCVSLENEQKKSMRWTCAKARADYVTLDSLPIVGSGHYTVKIKDNNDDLLIPLEEIRGKSILISMAGMHLLRGEDLFFVLSDNGSVITGPYYVPVRPDKSMRRRARWRKILYTLALKKHRQCHSCGIDITPMIRQQ